MVKLFKILNNITICTQLDSRNKILTMKRTRMISNEMASLHFLVNWKTSSTSIHLLSHMV